MFGHKDEDEQKEEVVMPAAEPMESDDNGASVGTGPVTTDDSSSGSAPAPDADTDASDAVDESPTETPMSLPTPSATNDDSDSSLSSDEPVSSDDSAPMIGTGTSVPADNSAPADDLLNLKKEALEELVPLVGHLDQTPEERFKTTMMMIQATDASGLISQAYDAAKEITDEKARAQALLDVVNEINYFTQAANAPK
jgi:hypothetical protein